MKQVVKIIRAAIIIGALSLAVYMVTDQISNRYKIKDVPAQVELNEHSGEIIQHDEETSDEY
jgi:uncharacterized protein YajQ (UPF0234 family)